MVEGNENGTRILLNHKRDSGRKRMTRGRDLPKLNSNPTYPHVTNALPLPLHLVDCGGFDFKQTLKVCMEQWCFFVVVSHRGKFWILFLVLVAVKLSVVYGLRIV